MSLYIWRGFILSDRRVKWDSADKAAERVFTATRTPRLYGTRRSHIATGHTGSAYRRQHHRSLRDMATSFQLSDPLVRCHPFKSMHIPFWWDLSTWGHQKNDLHGYPWHLCSAYDKVNRRSVDQRYLMDTLLTQSVTMWTRLNSSKGDHLLSDQFNLRPACTIGFCSHPMLEELALRRYHCPHGPTCEDEIEDRTECYSTEHQITGALTNPACRSYCEFVRRGRFSETIEEFSQCFARPLTRNDLWVTSADIFGLKMTLQTDVVQSATLHL